MGDLYSWVKVAHIISVISWMVGFLYLPRLFVYHFDTKTGSECSDTFKVMERRLMKIIMTPAMIATWGFGIWLAVLSQAWSEGWFVTKFSLVFILTFLHFILVKWVKEFANDERLRSQKLYRIVNEVPAVIMILIVILVVVKPF